MSVGEQMFPVKSILKNEFMQLACAGMGCTPGWATPLTTPKCLETNKKEEVMGETFIFVLIGVQYFNEVFPFY